MMIDDVAELVLFTCILTYLSRYIRKIDCVRQRH